MKKIKSLLLFAMTFLLAGCSIDYTAYYEKYGNVANKKEQLTSEIIDEEIKNYPDDNSELISKYGAIYTELEDDYEIYATYYSSKYDTLYISYDNKDEKTQTITSKGLALIEEHLLNYFEMDSEKTVYNKYLNVVRIYPDYASSACREDPLIGSNYEILQGCAFYDTLGASVNLNNLNTLEVFFKPETYTKDNLVYYIEPRRDTFAHEFGHVFTYYHLILKGDDSYEDYLRIRLGNQFDNVYPGGLPNSYGVDLSYYVQPVEILADDYVELYYNTSSKKSEDYYDYTLEYQDLRNSLTDVEGVDKFLVDNASLFDKLKKYFDELLNLEKFKYETPKIVNFSGDVYQTLNNIKEDESVLHLEDKEVIVIGEIVMDGKEYYRAILSNVIIEMNTRWEYSQNIGFILKENCTIESGEVIYFTKYDGTILTPQHYLPMEGNTFIMLPYYDFSYYVNKDSVIKIYNYLDSTFGEYNIQDTYFK